MGRCELAATLAAVLALSGCSRPSGSNARDIGGYRYLKRAPPREHRPQREGTKETAARRKGKVIRP